MHTLRMLGVVGLSDDGQRELDGLLRQPKHVALLAYLALPLPGTWHRRDTILATFWAENDQSRARSALRSALYTVRRHLPDGAIISRGDDEVSIDAALLQTDVAMMRDDIAATRYEQALAHYRGELLPGLFVADAPAFDSWIATERERLRGAAQECAAALADAREKSGDFTGAITAARRGAEFDPNDEAATRRLIALLDRSGDRAGAFAVYERFRNHMTEAFGVRPSAETVALLDAVRTRREPSFFPPKHVPSPTTNGARHDGIGAAATAASIGSIGAEHVNSISAGNVHPPVSEDVHPIAAEKARPLEAEPVSKRTGNRMRWTASGGLPKAARVLKNFITSHVIVTTTIICSALLFVIARETSAWKHLREPSVVARRVAVLPFDNMSRDTSLALVGRIAANWFTEAIAQSDSVEVVSSTAVSVIVGEASATSPDAVRRVASATGAARVVTGNFMRFGDSLRVQAILVDPRSNSVIRAIGSAVGPVSDPLVAINKLREQVLGSLAIGDLTRTGAVSGPPPKYSAYRELVTGRERFARGDYAGARQFLEHAIAIEPTFFAPYLLLAGTYTSVGDLANAERVVAHLDSLREQLSSTDRLGLELAKAMVTGDLESELRTSQSLSARYGNLEFGFLTGRSATRLLRPRIAIPVLKSLEPSLTGSDRKDQLVMLAMAYHQAGDHATELATLERGRQLFPGNRMVEDTELATLAALRDAKRALALADTMLRSQSDAERSERLPAVLFGAMEFRAHGDSLTSQRLARAVLDWDRAHSAPASSSNRPMQLGTAWLLVGKFDSAATQFHSIERDTSNVAIAGFLGLIAARKGDRLRAHAISDSLGTVQRRWTFGSIPFWRAAILGQLGERELAMELLRQSVNQGTPLLHFHYIDALASLRGYAPFEAMLVPMR